VQSYEKAREIQKESLLFFLFPSDSNFGASQSYEKAREIQKESLLFFLF
jgi:hypothetical protein